MSGQLNARMCARLKKIVIVRLEVELVLGKVPLELVRSDNLDDL